MSNDSESGFTLIELLAVIAILTATAMLVGPRIVRGGGEGVAIRTGGAELVSRLAGARRDAIAQGRSLCLALIDTGGTENCAVIDLNQPVTVAAATPGTIRFFADGSSSGGTVTQAAGEARATVRVVGATGQIMVR